MQDDPAGQEPSSQGSTHEAAATAGVVAPPPLLCAAPLAAGLLIQHWHPARILAPSIATAAGMVCTGLGFVSLPAILAFRRANTSPKPWVPSTALVTTGPDRFTRNPMYLGFTLLYVGAALWTNAFWPLLFLPVVLAVMHYGVIVREEAYMARKFGDDTSGYSTRTSSKVTGVRTALPSSRA